MSTSYAQLPNSPLPSPFPEGWYFVASRQAVQKARLLQKTWMGENIVVWCDENGGVCVAEAYCPHLGSDLGPAAGGRVCGGRLVCPFHGFEYDASGQCVATPYADPPRNAKLRVFETREILGLIFAWWGILGREPQWRLPADPPDQAGWSNFAISAIRFPGHPQETTENSVDLAHLRYVHGYDSVSRVERVSATGPVSRAASTSGPSVGSPKSQRLPSTSQPPRWSMGWAIRLWKSGSAPSEWIFASGYWRRRWMGRSLTCPWFLKSGRFVSRSGGLWAWGFSR